MSAVNDRVPPKHYIWRLFRSLQPLSYRFLSLFPALFELRVLINVESRRSLMKNTYLENSIVVGA